MSRQLFRSRRCLQHASKFSPFHKLLEWDLLSVEQIQRTELGLVPKQFLSDVMLHNVLKIYCKYCLILDTVLDFFPLVLKRKLNAQTEDFHRKHLMKGRDET